MAPGSVQKPTDNPVLVCFGAGGHASVVTDAALLSGWRIAGYVVRAGAVETVETNGPNDLPIIGVEGSALRYRLEELGVSHFIVGVGSLAADRSLNRRAAFEAGLALGLTPAVVVHAKAIVAPSVKLGPGTFVAAGAVLNPYTETMSNVIINTGALIDHHCRIEDHANIAPGCVLGGAVHVGRNGHINIGAVVLKGLAVGPDATVASGAVVTRNVDGNTFVVGAPARPHRLRPPN